ncbi:hypothetical protein J6590_031918 [Homalodisca vitripennis]|nr:hypothetical protein J6590_031918 [Homalodisca vitripennis]
MTRFMSNSSQPHRTNPTVRAYTGSNWITEQLNPDCLTVALGIPSRDARLQNTVYKTIIICRMGGLPNNLPSRACPSGVPRLSQDNRIKQRRAWLLLGWVTAERSCPCKQPACPTVGGFSEVTYKQLVLWLSVSGGFLALTSPGRIRHIYFTFALITKAA